MTKLNVRHKKEQIYLEAIRLFREKGYPSTSMRDLAQRVGLEPSSLYSHIRSKEEILQSICFDCANRFLEGMKAIMEDERKAHGRIRALIDLHITIAYDDPASITVFNDEWRHLSEPYLSDFLSMRKTYEQSLIEILKEGIDSGELITVKPEIAMYCILSALRWVHLRHPETIDRQQLVDSIGNILLGGLLTYTDNTTETHLS